MTSSATLNNAVTDVWVAILPERLEVED